MSFRNTASVLALAMLGACAQTQPQCVQGQQCALAQPQNKDARLQWMEQNKPLWQSQINNGVPQSDVSPASQVGPHGMTSSVTGSGWTH